jgi:hypothetical protein
MRQTQEVHPDKAGKTAHQKQNKKTKELEA